MVGIVDGRAARLILRSGRATHPVPGSRGHLAEKRPRHPDRTAPRHTKLRVRGIESLRLQTAVVVFSRPLARWGADPRDTYPSLHVFVYSVIARGLRLPSVSAGRFAPGGDFSRRWRWWEARKRGGWLNDEHSATRRIGSRAWRPNTLSGVRPRPITSDRCKPRQPPESGG